MRTNDRRDNRKINRPMLHGAMARKSYQELEEGRNYVRSRRMFDGTEKKDVIKVTEIKNSKRYGVSKYAVPLDEGMGTQWEVYDSDNIYYDDDVPPGMEERFQSIARAKRLEAGDIIAGTRHYTMSIPVFYQVLKRTPSMVELVKLRANREYTDRYYNQGPFIAYPSDLTDGRPIRAKVQKDGLEEYVHVDDCFLRKWSGKPLSGNDMD